MLARSDNHVRGTVGTIGSARSYYSSLNNTPKQQHWWEHFSSPQSHWSIIILPTTGWVERPLKCASVGLRGACVITCTHTRVCLLARARTWWCECLSLTVEQRNGRLMDTCGMPLAFKKKPGIKRGLEGVLKPRDELHASLSFVVSDRTVKTSLEILYRYYITSCIWQPPIPNISDSWRIYIWLCILTRNDTRFWKFAFLYQHLIAHYIVAFVFDWYQFLQHTYRLENECITAYNGCVEWKLWIDEITILTMPPVYFQ